MINPTVRIISLIAFAAMLQSMPLLSLAIFSGILLLMVILIQAADFWLLLRRARWLLISVVLIFAYATPGEYINGLPESLAPTFEGLHAGGIQALRLVVMLAALSVLLATTDRAEIMAGIYQLSLPLSILKISPERFAARLWLTLHYVEHLPPVRLSTLSESHWDIDAPRLPHAAPEIINMQFPRWRRRDILVLLMLPLLWWCTR